MSADLNSLIELEKLDREIAKLENSKMEFPKKVTEMEAILLAKKGQLTVAQERLDKHLSDVTKWNNSLEENNQALNTSHDRLNLVKTNREYDAILLEISERKEMVERDRKRIQKSKEKEASLTEALSEAQKEYDDEVGVLQPQIDELSRKIGSIDDDVKAVHSKRETIEQQVPATFLPVYTSIKEKRKNGKSLSVISTSSKACGYCYQILNERVKKAAQQSDEPIFCENCGSIVVWIDEPKEAPKEE